MMKTDIAYIKENRNIAKDVYLMRLQTDLSKEVHCGQFIQIEIPQYFLRRPISVCEVKENEIVIVYKVVGGGTKALSCMHENETLNIFGPCGRGFSLEERDVLLIGGGIGVPPLLETAKQYKGHKVTAVLGFNSREDMILADAFLEAGCEVFIATMDGSCGTKGTVIDAIKENHIEESFVLSCGPLPMLKAVQENYHEGCISLEARMACGIGACMGCVVKDAQENSYRVCKDGPVFEIGKVVL